MKTTELLAAVVAVAAMCAVSNPSRAEGDEARAQPRTSSSGCRLVRPSGPERGYLTLHPGTGCSPVPDGGKQRPAHREATHE